MDNSQPGTPERDAAETPVKYIPHDFSGYVALGRTTPAEPYTRILWDTPLTGPRRGAAVTNGDEQQAPAPNQTFFGLQSTLSSRNSVLQPGAAIDNASSQHVQHVGHHGDLHTLSVVDGRARFGPVASAIGNAPTTGGTHAAGAPVTPAAQQSFAPPSLVQPQAPLNAQTLANQISYNPFKNSFPGQPTRPFWIPVEVLWTDSPVHRHVKALEAALATRKVRTPPPHGPVPKTTHTTANAGPSQASLPLGSFFGPVASENIEQYQQNLAMVQRLTSVQSGRSQVTVGDIVHLRNMERNMLSDLYILQGIFLPHPHVSGQDNEDAFIAAGLRYPSLFFEFEEELEYLEQIVIDRENGVLTEEMIGQDRWKAKLKAERDWLGRLYSELLNCKAYLIELRKYLEKKNGTGNVFKYDYKVKYTEIGNQVVPPRYPKETAPNKMIAPVAAASTPKADKSKKRKTAPASDPSDPEDSSSQHSTPSPISKPPPKKVKSNPPQVPRTTDDVRRDIAHRNAEIERLQKEIAELRWEETVISKEKGDRPAGGFGGGRSGSGGSGNGGRGGSSGGGSGAGFGVTST